MYEEKASPEKKPFSFKKYFNAGVRYEQQDIWIYQSLHKGAEH